MRSLRTLSKSLSAEFSDGPMQRRSGKPRVLSIITWRTNKSSFQHRWWNLLQYVTRNNAVARAGRFELRSFRLRTLLKLPIYRRISSRTNHHPVQSCLTFSSGRFLLPPSPIVLPECHFISAKKQDSSPFEQATRTTHSKEPKHNSKNNETKFMITPLCCLCIHTQVHCSLLRIP